MVNLRTTPAAIEVKTGGNNTLLYVVIALIVIGGLYYQFVYKPKQESEEAGVKKI